MRATMILAIDIQYQEDSALAAGVLFSSWDSDTLEQCELFSGATK